MRAALMHGLRSAVTAAPEPSPLELTSEDVSRNDGLLESLLQLLRDVHPHLTHQMLRQKQQELSEPNVRFCVMKTGALAEPYAFAAVCATKHWRRLRDRGLCHQALARTP